MQLTWLPQAHLLLLAKLVVRKVKVLQRRALNYYVEGLQSPRQSFKSSAVINELYSQPNMEIQKTIVNRGHQVRGQKWSKPTQLGINELLLIGNCPQFIVVGSYGWKLYPRVPPHISEELRNVTGRPLLGHLEPPGTIFKVALKNGTSTFFSYDFFYGRHFFWVPSIHDLGTYKTLLSFKSFIHF